MSAIARLDLHCHTLHSGDSFARLAQLVHVAVSRRVTHLAITDHDSCESWRRAGRGRWPIHLIFGEELTLANGTHLIGLDIHQEIRSKTLADALHEIRDVGGFSIVPHPFKKTSGIFAALDDRTCREVKKVVLDSADAIEVCNSKLPVHDNERAFALARELGKPVTAGADAHFGYDVGDAVLEVEADTLSVDWRTLVRDGHAARVLMNRCLRQKLFDEHLTDTRLSTTLPRIRRLVPKPLRTILKRTLHRAVYQTRVRHRDFVLEEVRL